MTLHYDIFSLPVEMHYDLYIFNCVHQKYGSNKKKTKTLTNFTKFTRFTSQKLIICLNQLNAVNRPFCWDVDGCIGPNCTGPSMGSLTRHIKLSPPVGECCLSVGVTPGTTPALSPHCFGLQFNFVVLIVCLIVFPCCTAAYKPRANWVSFSVSMTLYIGLWC